MQAALAQAQADALTQAEANDQLLDVIAGLKWLGFRAERARWGAETARSPGLTLEQHIKAALKLLAPKRGVTTVAPVRTASNAAPPPAQSVPERAVVVLPAASPEESPETATMSAAEVDKELSRVPA